MSILDPSYMIDLGGIDVIQSQGVAIPGLYQKLLDNIGPCGNPLIYNWKFNGVFIPPQFVEPILEDDAIYINDIYVSSDDVVHIPSIEIQPNIVQLNVSENGEYEAPEGVDGYNPVAVDVETGVPLLTRAQWDELTTQEKQAYGLVAIQNEETGFVRGSLLYGAEYVPLGIYIPYSDQLKIICEAYSDNFDPASLAWGYGGSPVSFSDLCSLSGDAVSIPTKTGGILASVDLGVVGNHFTAYAVMKTVSPTAYSRILSCFASRAQAAGIMLYGSTISVSSWANDTSLQVSSSDYFACAIQFKGSGNALGGIYGKNLVSKPPSTCGRYVVIGRTDLDPSTQNAEPCDTLVKYLAVVLDDETQETIEANLQVLYNSFLA